ncbi:hypothetical protein HDU93_001317 [Gonapodya sp. JEL0774]|nr:hypothetical protein HDU93_001317 [Gonapodya sp. JEL0774]
MRAQVSPLLPNELARGCFQVVDVRHPQVHVHVPVASSHRGPGAIRTSSFEVDLAFEPERTNEEVYQNALSGIVELALGGGVGTVLAYGQTGSGKTYTMAAMSQNVARDVFEVARSYRRRQDPSTPIPDNADFSIHYSAFEIFGPNTYDLLAERQSVQIAEDKFGSVQVVGTKETEVTNASELQQFVEQASLLRRTESTLKNDTSSRSHAVHRLRIVNQRVPESEDGLLYLVDLAGSEYSADVAEHTKERLAETKEINKSLSALKDCIRNRAMAALSPDKHVHIPYRLNRLTLLLKDVFELESRRRCGTVVFACVSPSVFDTSATLNTLRYIEPLRVPIPKARFHMEFNAKNPATWDNAYLRKWVAISPVDPEILCPTESGRQILRIPEGEFLERCLRCKGITEKRAKAFYIELWRLLIDARTADRKKKLKARPQAAASRQMESEILAIMAAGTESGEKVKAAVVVQHKSPLVLKEVTVPEINADEVLVKIVASGVCHSDLHIADGEMAAMNRTPIILGHEGVGVVCKIGGNVKNLKIGERVAIGNVNSACNACTECQEGRDHHCKKYVQTGGMSDGCYCQYQKISAFYCTKIPDGIPFTEAAPVACAGHTVYSAVRSIKQKPGSYVAVIVGSMLTKSLEGIGGLGHLAIQYARALGYLVIGIDVAQDKLDLALKLGARKVFNAADPKLASEVMRFTGGGCMGVIVTAVHESAFATSIKISKMNATCVWISLPSNPIQILPKIVVFKALQITGSMLGNRADLEEAYKLVASGLVKPIVETFSMEDINSAWDRMRSGKFTGRMVMVVDPQLINLKTSVSAAQIKL